MLVFVYGTLKPGLRYYAVAERAGAFTAEEAYLDGFELYHLEPENYPALVPGSGRVHGWRYAYRDAGAALTVLDELESLHADPPEYERVLCASEPGGLPAWVYLYRDRARLLGPSASRVASGVWTPREGAPDGLPRGLQAPRGRRG